MILPDTSAWVRHLRVRDTRLETMLREQRVMTCDVVRGELALGTGLPPDVGELMARLPRLTTPGSREVMEFIARHERALRTVGVGWADVQIITAAIHAGARLYSHDRPQRTVWRRLGLRLA